MQAYSLHHPLTSQFTPISFISCCPPCSSTSGWARVCLTGSPSSSWCSSPATPCSTLRSSLHVGVLFLFPVFLLSGGQAWSDTSLHVDVLTFYRVECIGRSVLDCFYSLQHSCCPCEALWKVCSLPSYATQLATTHHASMRAITKRATLPFPSWQPSLVTDWPMPPLLPLCLFHPPALPLPCVCAPPPSP